MPIAPIPLDRLRVSATAARFQGHADAPGVPLDLSLFVTTTRPGAGSDPHHHPYPEIFVLLEGHVRYLVGDQELEVDPGHLVVVPPHTIHSYRNIGDVPLRQVSIHAAGTIVQHEHAPAPMR